MHASNEDLKKREHEDEANPEEGEKFSKIPRKEEVNPKNEEMELGGKEENAVVIPQEEENIHTSTNIDEDEVFLDTEINNAPGCLNTLAWLLEYDASSCTAVCIVNNTLLVSDNTIDCSTGDKKAQVQYIDSVIQHFAKLSAENTSLEKEKELLEKIFLQKLNGKEKGFFRKAFDQDQLKEIASLSTNILLENREKNNELEIKTKEIEASVIEKLILANAKLITSPSEKLNPAIQTCMKAFRRFQRVKDFLLNDAKKEETEIKKALSCAGKNSLGQRLIRLSDDGAAYYDDRDWLMNTEKKGYGILAVNVGTVHAELKIIDYFFASRIITFDTDDKTSYYIGVSKTCCSGCYGVVNLINEILGKNAFTVAGTHGHRPDNWYDNLPIFLLEVEEKMKEILDRKKAEDKNKNKKKETSKTKGKKTSQNKTEKETFDKVGEKESEKTKGKETLKTPDENISPIKQGLIQGLIDAKKNEATGYVAAFNDKNKDNEAKEKRVYFRSFAEMEEQRQKLFKEIEELKSAGRRKSKLTSTEPKTVKTFLVRDYELLTKIYNNFMILLENNKFYIYKENKSMSHPSPARTPNVQVSDFTTGMTHNIAALKLFLRDNPQYADDAVKSLLGVRQELDGTIKYAQELKNENNTLANTPSLENLAQSSALSLSAGAVEKKQESIGNLNLECELPIKALATMQETKSDNTSKDALLSWNNSPSRRDLDNPIQSTQKNQEL